MNRRGFIGSIGLVAAAIVGAPKRLFLAIRPYYPGRPINIVDVPSVYRMPGQHFEINWHERVTYDIPKPYSKGAFRTIKDFPWKDRK